MIRRLRDQHRRVLTLLALILPLSYLALLLSREKAEPEPVPITEGPGERVPVGPPFALLPEPRIEGRLLTGPGGSLANALQVTPVGDPGIPDLLAYWSPIAGDTPNLPPEAILIGALRGSRGLVLPMPDRAQDGYVLLFSLARREIVSRVRLSGVT